MQGTVPVGEAASSASIARPGSPGQHSIKLAQAPSLAPPAELRATVDSSGPITKLPAELLQHVAKQLGGRDRILLARTSKTIASHIGGEVDEAAVAHAASSVNTLTGFQAVLGGPDTCIGDGSRTVRSLRMDLQAEPLVALGLRIHTIPQQDRKDATATFRQQVAKLGVHGTARLKELDRVAAHATKWEAIRAGESVLTAAEFFEGLTWLTPEVYSRPPTNQNINRPDKITENG